MSTPEHLVTIRRRGAYEPSYGPSRDLVWLFPDILQVVGQSLDDKFLEPFVRKFAERNGVTAVELARAYHRLAEAVVGFTDWEKDHPAAAVDEVGLFDAAPAARLVLFAKLGMATLSVAHHHMRGACASPVDERILRRRLEEVEQFAAVLLANAAAEARP